MRVSSCSRERCPPSLSPSSHVPILAHSDSTLRQLLPFIEELDLRSEPGGASLGALSLSSLVHLGRGRSVSKIGVVGARGGRRRAANAPHSHSHCSLSASSSGRARLISQVPVRRTLTSVGSRVRLRLLRGCGIILITLFPGPLIKSLHHRRWPWRDGLSTSQP